MSVVTDYWTCIFCGLVFKTATAYEAHTQFSETCRTKRQEALEYTENDEKPKIVSAASPQTPHYYEVAEGKDLYAIFKDRYGVEALLQHLEMEAIQYLWRCRTKGQYVSDVAKVQVICARILKEKEEQRADAQRRAS